MGVLYRSPFTPHVRSRCQKSAHRRALSHRAGRSHGQFAASPVLVSDISVKGARFRHAHPVEMGQKSVLQLPIEGRPRR